MTTSGALEACKERRILLDDTEVISYTRKYMEPNNNGSMEHVFRLAEIEVEQSNLDDKIIGLFRFESNGQKKHGPILLVIAEINGTGYVYDQLIDVVNNEAEQSRTLTIGVDTDPVTRFEKVVQNINNAVSAFMEREPTPINWTRVNIFIVELSDGHACLTGVGRLMNMFLQKQADGSFKTFDLFGSLEQPPDVNPQKLFRSIICGDMKAGDVLIAGSSNLERLRNELRMKERLTTLPPVTAALELKQDLEREAIPDDFVAVIASCATLDQPKVEAAVQPPQGKSTASVEKMRDTEAKTLRQLAPVLGGRKETSKGEPLAPHVGGPLGLLAQLRRMIVREKAHDVAAMASMRGMHAGFGSFLTKRRKSLLISAVILALLILVAGSLMKHQRTTAAERAAWNATFDQAKGVIERANGEAVYSEDRARRSLSEAEEALTSLDAATEERKAAVAGLRKEADDLRVKLRRIVDTAQPTQLFALPAEIADGALTSPILFKGSLVVADRSSKELVVMTIENKETKRIKLPADAGQIAALAPGRESVIIAMQDGKLFAANLTDGKVGALSLGSDKAKAMTDITVYANRLYRLDAESGQIWRYPSVSGGFGAEQAYLQATNTNISDATSLAIDSNVYVLKSNGQVARFLSGGQDGFSLSPVDPPLEHGSSIWAETDKQYVAIADTQGKRVVLFTKEGRLVAQYTSSAFKGPTDVTADEATKKLYVVDGNNVYELPLP